MRLIPEWRRVLCHAYSVHFVAVSIFFGMLDTIANFWTLFQGLLPISPGWFAVLGLVFGAAGLIGRFIPQPKITGGSDADKQDPAVSAGEEGYCRRAYRCVRNWLGL